MQHVTDYERAIFVIECWNTLGRPNPALVWRAGLSSDVIAMFFTWKAQLYKLLGEAECLLFDDTRVVREKPLSDQVDAHENWWYQWRGIVDATASTDPMKAYACLFVIATTLRRFARRYLRQRYDRIQSHGRFEPRREGIGEPLDLRQAYAEGLDRAGVKILQAGEYALWNSMAQGCTDAERFQRVAKEMESVWNGLPWFFGSVIDYTPGLLVDTIQLVRTRGDDGRLNLSAQPSPAIRMAQGRNRTWGINHVSGGVMSRTSLKRNRRLDAALRERFHSHGEPSTLQERRKLLRARLPGHLLVLWSERQRYNWSTFGAFRYQLLSLVEQDYKSRLARREVLLSQPKGIDLLRQDTSRVTDPTYDEVANRVDFEAEVSAARQRFGWTSYEADVMRLREEGYLNQEIAKLLKRPSENAIEQSYLAACRKRDLYHARNSERSA
jgi:hypothetical protein